MALRANCLCILFLVFAVVSFYTSMVAAATVIVIKWGMGAALFPQMIWFIVSVVLLALGGYMLLILWKER